MAFLDGDHVQNLMRSVSAILGGNGGKMLGMLVIVAMASTRVTRRKNKARKIPTHPWKE